ncbi:hypothetical protein V1227_18710 [Lentzea sp. DG1S-22]|nr:hypothetical protein [Lentzea sp. DG1S-22]WVH84687.1 hypothetical protein V1227_18710 [Lentzea sp. DG1S-22]
MTLAELDRLAQDYLDEHPPPPLNDLQAAQLRRLFSTEPPRPAGQERMAA